EDRPRIAKQRDSAVYYPGTQAVPQNTTVNVLNRPHSITAEVEIEKGGSEGVLISQGGVEGGYSFYMKEGKLHYAHNYLASKRYHIETSEDVQEGRHRLRFEFEPTGRPDIAHGKGSPGRGQIYVDGKLVGQADIPVTIPQNISLGGGITCGADPGSTVTPDYRSPNRFTGKILKVKVDVSGELIKDRDAELRTVMARQ
ncbi:MAG: arylsulfatase, partial [Desulfomonilia bacterium]